jgi:hypothetical protein
VRVSVVFLWGVAGMVRLRASAGTVVERRRARGGRRRWHNRRGIGWRSRMIGEL